jgi:hypothetical protein
MATPGEPRLIVGSAGSRIKLILGPSGRDYLLLLEEDDGNRKWQSKAWNNIPPGLVKRISKVVNVHQVSFNSENNWFLKGDVGNWWNISNKTCEKSISDGVNSKAAVRVVFGDPDTQQFIVLTGANGYTLGSNLPVRLITALKNAKAKGDEILQIGGLNGTRYFWQSNTERLYQNFNKSLSKTLNAPGNICLSMASNDSWIVIRDYDFVASNGVNNELRESLDSFYSLHKKRQNRRREEIRIYSEQSEFEAETKRKQELLDTEDTQRLETERLRKEKEFQLKKKREVEDRISEVKWKGLSVGDQLTVQGMSTHPGDAFIRSILSTGEVQVSFTKITKNMIRQSATITIADPRRFIHYDQDSDSNEPYEFFLLAAAMDKYEAAMALYHCHCQHGICACKPVAAAISNQFCGFVESSAATMRIRPIFEHRIQFDEYRCAEKIDLRRLDKLVHDLQTDSDERKQIIQTTLRRLKQNPRQEQLQIWLKQLQRCDEMEATAKALFDSLKTTTPNAHGGVEYEVEYQHKDIAYRGRLFANGTQITLPDKKYPRTTTLQGIHSDLRATLVGEFAHDIDCENSEVRLLCSLASQMGLESLIPTIVDYRDNRMKWLSTIRIAHPKVSESEAKRLPTIILNGGRYETWLHSVGCKEKTNNLKSFGFDLSQEVTALRDQLLHHPRFRWTEIERQKLVSEGRKGGAVAVALLPRIVQSCENEVLGIIHHVFHRHEWRVRAKIFDGVIVEPPPKTATKSIVNMMRLAESACKEKGWDVRLAEKPLYGLQDDPISTVQESRTVIRILSDTIK